MSAATQKEFVKQETDNQQEPVGLLDKVLEATADKLDSMADRYAAALGSVSGRLRQAMLMAEAIEHLRAAITPEVMKRLKSLMNTPLGFQTDRGPGKKNATPYPDEIIRDCAIEALLYGLNWTGNEFNILAARMYATKEGFQHKFKDAGAVGVTDVRVSRGRPMRDQGGVAVRMGVRWKFNCAEDELKDADGKPGQVFAIPTRESDGPDAIIGKATRKALKAAWEQIFGSDKTPPDAEVEEAPAAIADGDGKTKTERLAEQLSTPAEPALSGARQPGEEPRDIMEPPESPYQNRERR